MLSPRPLRAVIQRCLISCSSSTSIQGHFRSVPLQLDSKVSFAAFRDIMATTTTQGGTTTGPTSAGTGAATYGEPRFACLRRRHCCLSPQLQSTCT